MASASSSSAIVNLTDEDLQFTDSTSAVGGTTHTFNEVPDSALDDDLDDDKANLLGEGRTGGAKYNFWSLEFYQQFFDVDDVEVKNRIVGAMIPRPGRSFLNDVLKKKPDLWGPLWICTTLVISVAVTGNLASYIQSAWGGETSNFAWHYDFHKVTLAATAVFSYAWLIPTFLYAFLWWTSSGALSVLSFLDLLCLYGYSLVIYIPVSVLWLIQYSVVQWILVLIGAGLSGAVIVMTLWPILRENSTKSSAIIILTIITLHLLLACGFMLYFFHVPNQGTSSPVDVKGADSPKVDQDVVDNNEIKNADKQNIEKEKSDGKRSTEEGVEGKGKVRLKEKSEQDLESKTHDDKKPGVVKVGQEKNVDKQNESPQKDLTPIEASNNSNNDPMKEVDSKSDGKDSVNDKSVVDPKKREGNP